MRFLLFTALLCWNLFSYACSCDGKMPEVKEAVRSADIVATGTVLSREIVLVPDSVQIALHPEDVFSHKKFPFAHTVAKYKVRVERKFKGVTRTDTITVYSGLGGGDCGIKLTAGEKYIFYAEARSYFTAMPKNKNFLYPSGVDIYWVSSCSRTAVFDELEAEELTSAGN